MPIYEYHCPACEATYELQQSFSAQTTHTCEECKKGTAKRVLHAPRVVFKGSGWYATDSRKSASTVEDAGGTPAKDDAKPPESPPGEASPKVGSEPASAAAAG